MRMLNKAVAEDAFDYEISKNIIKNILKIKIECLTTIVRPFVDFEINCSTKLKKSLREALKSTARALNGEL